MGWSRCRRENSATVTSAPPGGRWSTLIDSPARAPYRSHTTLALWVPRQFTLTDSLEVPQCAS